MKRRTYLRSIAGTVGTITVAPTTTALASDGSEGRGRPTDSSPANALDPSDRETITQLLEAHVADGTFPGAAVAVVGDAGPMYEGAVGDAQTVPVTRDLTEDTVFDLASMTKAVATTTSVLQLVDRDELGLQDSLCEFYPEIPDGDDKCEITVENLLTQPPAFRRGFPSGRRWTVRTKRSNTSS